MARANGFAAAVCKFWIKGARVADGWLAGWHLCKHVIKRIIIILRGAIYYRAVSYYTDSVLLWFKFNATHSGVESWGSIRLITISRN